MTKTNTTIEFFDKYAREYDVEQRALVPGYEDILAMIADAYGHYAGAGAFLDLGCGTGNLSCRILKDSPASRAFLLDGSAAMAEIACKKIRALAGDDAVLGSKVANLETRDWHEGIGFSFDAIVSAFVLEHLNDDDFRAVIRRCHDLLRPGGVFINLEFGDDSFGMQSWFKSHMQKNIDAHDRFKSLVEESHEKERHYFVKIEEKMNWWSDAGFKNVHTIWQRLFAYIVVGER